MVTPQPAFRATPVDHEHLAGETCPYCEQPIPNDRAEEIRARYAFKQQQNEAALKARADKQIAEARTELEAAKKVEIEKIQADALAQKTAALEAGKKVAEEAARQKIEALTAAREADALKVTEAEQKRLAAVSQFEALKAQTEVIAAARAAEVRAALEKASAEAMNAKDAQHAEAMQKVSDQLTAMQRRVESVEGEGADIDLFETLKEQFPKDEITRINKSDGANIIHTVKHNKKECGKIVYDTRNRNIWQTKFATKLHDDMVTAKAMHAILTTSKFPTGFRQIHLCEGVIAANPARALVLAEIIRDEIVRNFSQRVSELDRSKKTTKLYDFITSEQFSNQLDSLDGNDDKLLKLDEEEQKVHKRTWESRHRITTSSQRLHANLRIEVARIVGTAEAE
jgi:hypothetical protein